MRGESRRRVEDGIGVEGRTTYLTTCLLFLSSPYRQAKRLCLGRSSKPEIQKNNGEPRTANPQKKPTTDGN